MDNRKNLRERYTGGTYNNGTPLENSEKFIDEVSKKGSSLEELNFMKNVIGSDETGKGEAFRPLIVVAAYVKKENVEKLIEYNVRDSKSYKIDNKDERMQYELTKKKICDIGKKLTGFTSYADFEKQRENGIVIEKDYVAFVANVIPNGVYNEKWKSKKTKKGCLNQHELIRDEHAAVVKLLAQEVKYDYIVVDNFEEAHPDNIQEKIALPKDKMIIAAKADEFAIAVACASVIAKYLGYLYTEELAADYGLDEFKDLGKTGKITPEMRDQLWEKLKNPRLFFKNYVKKFDNVVDCLNDKEEGLGKLYDEA